MHLDAHNAALTVSYSATDSNHVHGLGCHFRLDGSDNSYNQILNNIKQQLAACKRDSIVRFS